jgi:hypothetical protein
VSEDGSVLSSNPGVGVVKAGWHCGTPPSGQGCAASCAICFQPDASCKCQPVVSDPRLANINVPGDCKRPICTIGPIYIEDPLDIPPPCSICQGSQVVPNPNVQDGDPCPGFTNGDFCFNGKCESCPTWGSEPSWAACTQDECLSADRSTPISIPLDCYGATFRYRTERPGWWFKEMIEQTTACGSSALPPWQSDTPFRDDQDGNDDGMFYDQIYNPGTPMAVADCTDIVNQTLFAGPSAALVEKCQHQNVLTIAVRRTSLSSGTVTTTSFGESISCSW